MTKEISIGHASIAMSSWNGSPEPFELKDGSGEPAHLVSHILILLENLDYRHEGIIDAQKRIADGGEKTAKSLQSPASQKEEIAAILRLACLHRMDRLLACFATR
jgi:hypothetical protein